MRNGDPMKKIGKVLILSSSILIGSSSIPYYVDRLLKAEAASVQYYQTTADLNLRSAANTNNKPILVIPKGKIVASAEKQGVWHKVSYTYSASGKAITKTGWVSAAYLKLQTSNGNTTPPVSVEKMTDTTFVTKAALNLKETTDLASKTITTIPLAKIVLATHKASNGLYKVVYNGKTGFIPVNSIQQVQTGDPLTGRDGYQFIDLRTQSPVTAQQIDNYIAQYVNKNNLKSVLIGKGQAFINTGKKYNINALYLAAHAIHESKYGTSKIAFGKNNLFGFAAYDATPYVASYRFNSVEDCIDYIAQEMKATYLNQNNWKHKGAYLGFSTKDMSNKRIDANSEGMNFYYASDYLWGKKIAQHMQNILPYDKAYYSKAPVNTVVPAPPTIPTGSEVFPTNVTAIAKTTLVLNSKKDSNDRVKTLKSGTKFFILEKTNDFWVKVKFGNKIYWTSDIKFHQYRKYISVVNLARTTDSVNFRKDPTITNGNIITMLNMNEYVAIVLQKDGTPTMDSTNKWYKVKRTNGTIGWVYADYLVFELK